MSGAEPRRENRVHRPFQFAAGVQVGPSQLRTGSKADTKTQPVGGHVEQFGAGWSRQIGSLYVGEKSDVTSDIVCQMACDDIIVSNKERVRNESLQHQHRGYYD